MVPGQAKDQGQKEQETRGRRLKILAVSYLFPNGGAPDFGIFVLNRLKALSGLCDIRVINPVPWFPFCYRLKRYRHLKEVPKREIIQGIEVYHPRFFIVPGLFKFIDGISFMLVLIPKALKLRKIFDFDLIDLHWTYPDLPGGRLLSRLTGRKQLVTIRGKEALCPGEKTLRQLMIRRGIAASHAVIALSRELGADAVRLGASPGKVSVIRNGVDLEAFYPVDRCRARERLNVDPEATIVISVGSLIRRKGHDRVIRGLPAVLKTHPSARLYILGSQGPEGDFRGELESLVRDLGLGDRVVFQGHVPHGDLVWWYSAADLFCLLSRGEGSPNVLTEALACGCPAVASPVGAVADILDTPGLGIVAPEDEPGMAAAMADAAAISWDRDAIARHMKEFGWPWCAGRVFELYRRLAESDLN